MADLNENQCIASIQILRWISGEYEYLPGSYNNSNAHYS
jgi:hypothetical protein